VKIPNSVTSIGNFAFYGCTKLTDIEITNSVISIGNCAFSNCDSIESITIPKNVAKIGEGAFTPLEKLKEINVSSENANFVCENGVLFDKDKTELILYLKAKEDEVYTIPETVKIIGCGAFYNANNLVTINVPDGLTTVKESAFYGCDYLENIVLPDSVSYIGEGAFDNYYFGGFVDDKIEDGIIYCGNHIISSDRSVIKGSLKIKEGIKTISPKAFMYNANITEVIFPESLVFIGNDAFSNCTGIEKLDLPSNLRYIDNYAFWYCCMTEISIPKSVKYIGYGAFDISNENEVKVTYNGSESQWEQVEIEANNDVFYYCLEIANDCKHTETNAVNAVPATCTAGGFTGDIYCAECGEKIKDNAETAALGHDFSGNPIETKATFFKDGSKVYHCTHDGCIETRTEITLSTINRILAWFRNIFSFKF
jgi:hypothetical protein